MITINVIKRSRVFNWKRRLLSRILKRPKRCFIDAAKVQHSTTVVEANEVLADALIAVDTVKSVSNNALTEILKDDFTTILKHILTTLLAMVKQVLSQFTLCQK
jgi:hypothetical protein